MHALRRILSVAVILIMGGHLLQAQEALSTDLAPERLPHGQAVTRQIVDQTSTTLYTFDGTAGDTVRIEMNARSTELDPFLVLLDASGGVVAMNDDRLEGVRNAVIESAVLPADGPYIVVASTFENLDEFLSFSSPEPLAYDIIALGFNPPPPSRRPATLTTKHIDVGDTFTGESTPERPVTYVTFDATAGQTLDLIMRRVDGIDPVLHIFDANGQRIALDDDDQTSPTFTVDAAVYGLAIPADGRYLILATDVFFYNASAPDAGLRYTSGRFTLEVRQTATTDAS